MSDGDRITIEEYKALQGVTQRAKRVTPKHDSKAEFLQQVVFAGLPPLQPEVLFHPWRKFRFDFAYPDLLIAVEYQGGLYIGRQRGKNDNSARSGHRSIAGVLRDIEKITEAQLLGWIVILIEPKSVRDGRALRWLENAVALRESGTGKVSKNRMEMQNHG